MGCCSNVSCGKNLCSTASKFLLVPLVAASELMIVDCELRQPAKKPGSHVCSPSTIASHAMRDIPPVIHGLRNRLAADTNTPGQAEGPYT